MEYGTLVKSKIGFTILSLMTSIAYWLIFIWWNNVSKKYEPLILATIFYFLLLFPLLMGLNIKYSMIQFKKSVQKVPYSEYGKIVIIIFSVILYSYFFLIKAFQYHSVSTIRLVEFVTTIFVNMVMIYIFYNNIVDIKLIIGMLLTGIGGYLVITNNSQ